jgi:hypothetical protein
MEKKRTIFYPQRNLYLTPAEASLLILAVGQGKLDDFIKNLTK